MSVPFLIAARYIRAKKNSQLISLISVITILGITIGVTVLIIALTVLNGFERTVENKIIGFNEHIVISGYSGRNLPYSQEIIDDITDQSSPYQQNIFPFISKNVIIKSSSGAEGVQLFGIEKSNELDLKKYIIAGKYFDKDSNNPELLIGRKLADRLSVKLNDKITILALKNDQIPSYFNPPAIKQFRITGIFESGMAEYDDLRIYTSIESAAGIFNMSNTVSGYNIKLNNVSKIDSIEKKLQDYLSYPFYVQSIFRIHQNIFTWLELQRKPIPIILAMVILVAAFNMIGTILMIVLERTPDIGLLKAMGMNNRGVLKVFLYQGTFLSLIGVIGGNLLAIVITLLQLNFNIISLPASVYFISEVPISIDPGIYLVVSLIALFICFLTTIVPGYIASKLNIINAIRFE